MPIETPTQQQNQPINPPPTDGEGPIENYGTPSLGTKIKHWFTSLIRGDETAREFKGKIGIGTGFVNLIIAYLVDIILIVTILTAISLIRFGGTVGQSILSIAIHLMIAIISLFIVMSVIGIISWLIFSLLSHITAGLLGGHGSYGEYAALLTFPQAGGSILGGIMWSLVITLFAFLANPRSASGGLINLIVDLIVLIISLVVLISQIKITKEEYGLGTGRAVVAVLLPVIVLFIFAIGLAFLFLFLWVTAFTAVYTPIHAF